MSVITWKYWGFHEVTAFAKIIVTYILVLRPRLKVTGFSGHTCEIMRTMINGLCEIHSCLRRCKAYSNRWRFGKVIVENYCQFFLNHGVYTRWKLQIPYTQQNKLLKLPSDSCWIKVNESIDYKPLSYLQNRHNLISLQPLRSTHSSSVVTLLRPPTFSSLKITDRSFRCA